ncbi:alanine racemase [Streptomyces sp. NPDC058045]|uniref:alanine racemase n=1 Tax=Streptomyces sp. NPDC058045 TaxID=3346311 RepID=UPI0036EFA322
MHLIGGPSEAVLTAAAEVPTPAVVYDLDHISRTVRQLRDDVSGIPGTGILFAVKANRFPPVLSHLAALATGADVASRAEYEAAAAASMRPVTATSPGLTGSEMSELAANGVLVDLCSRSQLQDYARCAGSRGTAIGLRVRVPVAPVERAGAGIAWSRLGVDPSDRELHRLLAEHELRVTRLHAHTGELMTARRAEQLLAALLHCTDLFPHVTTVNIGGGLASLYADPRQAEDAWQRIGALLREHAERSGRRLALVVEPGMLLTALAGYLVVTALAVEQHPSGTAVVTVDGSGWSLLSWTAPRLVGQLPARDTARFPYSVGGSSCYEEDYLVRHTEATEIRPGDRLVLNAAGAYVTSMARAMHGSPAPFETAVSEKGRRHDR